MDFRLSEEQLMIRDTVRDIVAAEVAPHAARWDEEEHFPMEVLKTFGEQGLYGLFIPEAYGGSGAGSLATIVAIEEVAKVCAGTASCFGAQPLSCYPLLIAGSEELKQRYLPRVAAGEAYGAFALSEAGAGSDVGALATTAVKDGSDYVLTGVKTWITSGNIADFVIVYAKTDQAAGARGLSAFVVDKGTPGFKVGKTEKKMGIRASHTVELYLEEVRVPASQLLGAEGDGFKIAMKTLDRGRPTVAAIALGIAEGAFAFASNYARERRAFGQPIGMLQAIQMKIADMATKIHAARLMLYETGTLLDEKVEKVTQSSAMSKVYTSDVAMEVTTEAVQILGGYGYSREYPVERYMRDAKITQIFEGTNEIQRIVIAREVLGKLG